MCKGLKLDLSLAPHTQKLAQPRLAWLSGLNTSLRIQRVACSIPSQGTRRGCGPGPQLGAPERQPHIDVALSLFLPPFPSL